MSGADWTDLLGRRGTRRAEGKRRALAVPAPGAWLWGAALVLAGVAAAGGAGVAVQQGHVLPLERVAVTEGVDRVAGQDLRAALAPHLHRSLLGVDIRGARAELEAIEWVGEAELRRAWPGTLEVRLDERDPLARWGEAALLEADGTRFEPPPATLPEGLPRLSGPEGSEQKVVGLFKNIQQLFDEQGVNLAALSLSTRGAWSAELAGGVEVALGRHEPQQRAERFAAALPALEAREEGEMERVDLRYPNGFAVAWGEAEQAD